MSKRCLPFVFFLLAFCRIACSHPVFVTDGDTVPYEIGRYAVKKTSTLWDISKKIKIDAALLAKLNQVSNLNAMIDAGSWLLIPVYGSGKPAKGSKAVQAKREDAVPKSDTLAVKQPPPPPVNVELEKNRLLLIEATLELNQTLLQGVEASIDSLNVEDKPLSDKDSQGKLRQMERQRDRILIRPYLLHIQDSLSNEIANEEKDKRNIDALLSGKPIVADNAPPPSPVSTGTKPVSAETMAKRTDTMTVAPPVRVKEPEAAANNTDTIKPPALTRPTEPSTKPADNHVAAGETPMIIEVTPTQPSAKKHWTAAKALPSLAESFFLQGMRDVPLISENTATPHTVDTAAYVSHFNPEDGRAGQPLNAAHDSIDLLKAQLLLARATTALNERNDALAADYLQKAVDLNPKYYEGWFMLADLHLQEAYPAKALKEFKICESIDSSSAKLYYKMGSSAFRSAQKDEAYIYFKRSLSIDPNYAPSIMGLGQTLTEKKQYDDAITEFGHVLALNKGFHSAYKSRGIAEYMSGNYAAAIDDFTSYLLFEDKDGASYYYRGMAELADKNIPDACADLNMAVRDKYPGAQRVIDKNCAGR